VINVEEGYENKVWKLKDMAMDELYRELVTPPRIGLIHASSYGVRLSGKVAARYGNRVSIIASDVVWDREERAALEERFRDYRSMYLVNAWESPSYDPAGLSEYISETLRTKQAEIVRMLQTFDLIGIVGALGGVSGTSIMLTLADMIENSNVSAPVFAVVVMPFEAEDNYARAERALEALRSKVDRVFVLRNQDLLRTMPDAPVSAGFARMDERVMDTLERVIGRMEKIYYEAFAYMVGSYVEECARTAVADVRIESRIDSEVREEKVVLEVPGMAE
jgi:hypothetical protein